MFESPWKNKFANCKEVGRFCGPVPSGILKNIAKEYGYLKTLLKKT